MNLIKGVNLLVDKKILRPQTPPDLRNKLMRLIWRMTWIVFAKPTPVVFHRWRCILLKAFGAKIHIGVHVYPSANIWAPWNLSMDRNSCLSEGVICYNVDFVHIGANAIVSQYSHLCTASHNYNHADHFLVSAPIIIGDGAWVAADVFIGPGVNLGKGAVALARAVVTKSVGEWGVVAGNPARQIAVRNERVW